MSSIATIRESLVTRISELESELERLREAVTHLGSSEDDTTPPDTSGDDTPSSKGKKSTGKRTRRSSSEVRSERLSRNRAARMRENGDTDDDSPAPRAKYGSRADEIMELTDQGLSAKEIAEELGTHPNYVYLVRRRELKSVS